MPRFEPVNDDIHFQMELSKVSSWSECKKFRSKNKLVKSNGKTYILLEKREIYSKTIGKLALGVLAVIFSGGLSLMFKNVRNLFTGREVKRLALLQTDVAPKSNNKKLFAEENLLPKFGTPIPLDVVKFMLKNLSVAEIARTIELNKSWHQLVKNDIIIQNNILVETCLAQSKNIAREIEIEEFRSDAFKKIITVEVSHNLNEAKKTLQNIGEDASNFVFASIEIAKKDPHYCLKRAKEYLSFIKDSFYKSRAQLEIVKVESLIDLERAKETARYRPNPIGHDFLCQIRCLLEIAKVDPEHNLSEAKKIAQDILYLETQAESFYKIVKLEVFFDLTNAKISAQSIQDSKFKSLALLEIVKVEVLHDLNLARETAHTIEDLVSKAEAYVEIAKADPEHDLTQAILHIHNIYTHDIHRTLNKSILFSQIAIIDIHHDLTLAKEEIKNLGVDTELYALALLQIVKVEVKYDLEAALRTALNIQYLNSRVSALIEIAKVHPSRDFTLAKIDALLINNSNKKSKVMLEIIQEEVHHCLIQARKTAENIEVAYVRQQALSVIAKEEARHNLMRAKETVDTMEDPMLKLETYLEVAKVALEKYAHVT